MEELRRITMLEDKQGFTATVQETDTPRIWELEWTGTPDAGRAYRMLKNADTEVLRNGGEVLVVNCPEEQAAVRNRLDRWPEHISSRTGDRYRLQLIYEAEDGLVHDDFDFRTPLHRITCPTCVEGFARKRTKAREDAFDEQGQWSQGNRQAYPAGGRGLRPPGGDRGKPGPGRAEEKDRPGPLLTPAPPRSAPQGTRENNRTKGGRR